MLSWFLSIFFYCIALIAMRRPYVGVFTYYLLSILGPQYIWWWYFDGLRASYIVALPTLLGIAFKLVKNKYDKSYIVNKQNFWLLILWASIISSYYFGSYSTGNPSARAEQAFSVTNIIFIFYFFSVLEISTISKLRYLTVVFALSVVYLTYWANLQYFTQNWGQFHMGRLMGPIDKNGGSIYGDENNFAVLFVTGMPFIYYWGWKFKKMWLRGLLWLILPFSCHAVFLTGSRGGLLGIVAVAFCIVLISKRKLIVLPLILLSLLILYQWQAGDIMTSRSQKIVNIEGEHSAGDRLTAWSGGLNMVLSHPLTGVGLGNFIIALPDFIESREMVAHSTVVQFAAESGFIAGCAYIVLIYLFFKNSMLIRSWTHKNSDHLYVQQIKTYNDASFASFVGLTICSIFLSMNTYEIFFVLMLINHALIFCCEHKTLD